MTSSILITGGSGSFGQALTKQLLKESVYDTIRIYSRGEHRQEEMEREIEDKDGRLRFIIGDVRDADRLRMAMRGCDTVVHAAAMKVVPKCEKDPIEAVKTNVYGAQNVIDAALKEEEVTNVLAISTDKACEPINLYGATKLAAEKLVLAANNLVGGRNTRFSVVRYGNVALSQGSVIPFFQGCLDRGEMSLPITHPEMSRFWITLEDGVLLVLNVLDWMQGGETYVPKIPSMRVIDIAEGMCEKWHEVGIRPGEKLHEVLITKEEATRTLDMGDYYVIHQAPAVGNLPEGWSYTSDENKERLTWPGFKGMMLAA